MPSLARFEEFIKSVLGALLKGRCRVFKDATQIAYPYCPLLVSKSAPRYRSRPEGQQSRSANEILLIRSANIPNCERRNQRQLDSVCNSQVSKYYTQCTRLATTLPSKCKSLWTTSSVLRQTAFTQYPPSKQE
jgi:hypothetical protein